MLSPRRLRLFAQLAAVAALPRRARDPRAARLLGALRGLPLQAAYLLAMRHLSRHHPEALHFAPLLTPGQPLPEPDLPGRIAHELGPRARLLLLPDHLPLASASTAQVYAAHAPDLTPQPLVLKLLLPQAHPDLEHDLAALHRLASALRPLLPPEARAWPGLLHDALHHLAAPLRAELDLQREADLLDRAHALLPTLHPRLHAPAPLRDLSSPRLLTMTRAPGQPLLLALTRASPQQAHDALAILLCAWLHLLLQHNLVHTAPHPANLYAHGPKHDPLQHLTLLDLAHLHPAPTRLDLHLPRLLLSAHQRSPPHPEDLAALLPAWADQPPKARLDLTALLLEPLLLTTPFDPSVYQLQPRLRDLQRAWPSAPPIVAPPSHLLLLRAFLFWSHLLRHARVRLVWRDLLPLDLLPDDTPR